MAIYTRHYEVWDSTPTRADIVGHADTLPAALMLYLRTRKTAPGHTINLLMDEPTSTHHSFVPTAARPTRRYRERSVRRRITRWPIDLASP